MLNTCAIKTAEIVSYNSLQVIFVEDWYQENIVNLTEKLFQKLDHCQITERVSGADKEYVRFNWNNGAFIVNFECYSQSCWIENEVETEDCEAHLKKIRDYLVNN